MSLCFHHFHHIHNTANPHALFTVSLNTLRYSYSFHFKFGLEGHPSPSPQLAISCDFDFSFWRRSSFELFFFKIESLPFTWLAVTTDFVEVLLLTVLPFLVLLRDRSYRGSTHVDILLPFFFFFFSIQFEGSCYLVT